jgi:hypothetical protein
VLDNNDKGYGSTKVDGVWYCSRCYYYLIGNTLDTKPKLNVRKEQFILAEIQRQMPELEPFFTVWDCPIEGGCSRKRPDMCYDFGTGSLIIEVDESGHKNYSCEDVRMLMLYLDLAERPIFFVRINPDKFEDRELMFRRTPKMLQLKCNQQEFDYRMNTLIENIKSIYDIFVTRNDGPSITFQVIYLFMNENVNEDEGSNFA